MNGKHARRTMQYPMGSVGFGDSLRRPRSAALSNLRPQIAGDGNRPGRLSSFASNKANRRCFRAENGVSAAEQTQSGWLVSAALSNVKSQIAGHGNPPGRLSSFVQNRPNFRRFWSENAGRAKKQSQSRPIYPAPAQTAGRHIRETRNQLIRTMEECDVEYFSDIDRSKVEAFLTRLRNQGLAARTYNAHLKTAKSFCKWMVESGYASQSPLVSLRTINQEVDRRHERRALSVEETCRLLKAAAGGDETHGMTGHERYLLYRLAIETGLRANEIRSLTKSSFDLDACTVTVVAGSSKRQRKDVQIISASLAAELKPFLATKMPATKAFGGRYKVLTVNTADVLRKDLAEAGIPYEDELGRVFDFHSLRGQCATLLALRGVHPKIAQTILRHSDISLTMNVYTRTDQAQKTSAVTGLSDLFGARKTPISEPKTGTDD